MRTWTRRFALAGMVVCGHLTVVPADADGGEAVLDEMATTARVFLASLDAEQRSKAQIPFNDDERLAYKTAPFPSEGVTYGALRDQQKILLHALLGASLSAEGYHKASSIMALEGYLVDLETERGRVNRLHGIDKYTVTVFGAPSETGTWAWRLQGHHLSLNFTIVNGALYVHAPAFLGAEPHRVTDGPRAGWHILGREELLGRELMRSLDGQQRAQATIAEEMPRDMFTGSKREAALDGAPEGISWGELDDAQRETLRSLVLTYVGNVPRDLAHTRLDTIESGGWDAIHFAWIGGIEPPAKNYYRVQGPEFIIEYCAVALGPNHIHTVWRDIDGDFGRDILAEHYNAEPH